VKLSPHLTVNSCLSPAELGETSRFIAAYAKPT
jgi:hypothetical protein